MHMGSVYSRASRVVVWLGEEYEDSDLAFDSFEALPGNQEEHWDPEKIISSMLTGLTKDTVEPWKGFWSEPSGSECGSSKSVSWARLFFSSVEGEKFSETSYYLQLNFASSISRHVATALFGTF